MKEPLDITAVKSSRASDFKILTMTFNMGQKKLNMFKETPEKVFQNIQDLDLIAVCA